MRRPNYQYILLFKKNLLFDLFTFKYSIVNRMETQEGSELCSFDIFETFGLFERYPSSK